MSRAAEILSELNALESPLAAMPLQAPFTVPDGYFESLAVSLAEGAIISGLEDAPLSVAAAKDLPFTAPADYFAGLAQNLTRAAIMEQKTREAHPLPYEAPEGYLEHLPAQMTAAAKAADGRRVRQTKLIDLRRVTRLAAAALLVLGIGFGSYRYLHPANADKIAAKQLSRLDGDAIHAYVEQHVDDFDSESLEEAAVAANQGSVPASISTLDTKDIQDYLRDGDETM